MANPRDLEILLKGVEFWNEWRTRHPDIIPDLSGLKFVMGSLILIADLTEPSSVAKELEAIVPHLAVPVQPLIEGRNNPYSMFKDYWKYPWVLEVCRYEGLRELDQLLRDRVIVQAEEKVRELLRMRNNRAENDIS